MTQWQTTSPWAPQQPYITEGFSEAQNLYNQGGPTYFPGNTVAPFGNVTREAATNIYNAAQQGTGANNAALNQAQQTLQGAYLPGYQQPDNTMFGGQNAGMMQPGAGRGQQGYGGMPGGGVYQGSLGDAAQGATSGLDTYQTQGQSGNPFLDSAYDSAAQAVTRNYNEAVAPGIQSQFANAGRTGSGLHANALDSSRDTLSRNLGGMASGMYGQAYQAERDNQMRALALAPQTSQLPYSDAQMMLNIGNIQDNRAQDVINADFQRHTFNQERPYDALGRYQSMISGNYGGTTAAPSYGGSNWATAAGLGLGGLGLINEYGGMGQIGSNVGDFFRGLF